MVPRLRRRGRHPGPCPSAVPGADERPAPHLRHHLPEPERRATRRRGGGPGEGRQVPPEPLRLQLTRAWRDSTTTTTAIRPKSGVGGAGRTDGTGRYGSTAVYPVHSAVPAPGPAAPSPPVRRQWRTAHQLSIFISFVWTTGRAPASADIGLGGVLPMNAASAATLARYISVHFPESGVATGRRIW